MLLVGHFPYRFVVGFKEQFVRRISLESASGNGALQLFPLTVSRIVPMRYQLLLTCPTLCLSWLMIILKEQTDSDELLVHNKRKSARKGNIIKKKSAIKNTGKLYDGRSIIIQAFSDGIFPEPPLLDICEWNDDNINNSVIKEVDEPVAQTSKTQLTIGTSSMKKQPNQKGQGFEILTPDEMLSRLPITLAQLQAGNNSQKLLSTNY